MATILSRNEPSFYLLEELSLDIFKAHKLLGRPQQSTGLKGDPATRLLWPTTRYEMTVAAINAGIGVWQKGILFLCRTPSLHFSRIPD